MAGTVAVTGADFVTDARRYLGIPYVFGGGPPANPRSGLDCSGLVQQTCFDLGIKSCPRTSEAQWAWVQRVAQPSPGDLVFFVGAPEEAGSPGHVGIYVSPGTMIDAPHSGTVVSIQHFDPNGTGENQVVGYGKIPTVQVSGSANPALAPQAQASLGAGGLVGTIVTIVLLGLMAVILIGGLFLVGVHFGG